MVKTEINRDNYLKQLISYQWDGQVKVITGIRRCGKSYLLMKIYSDYLLRHGVHDDEIIIIQLDLAKDIKYRNPLELSAYVRSIANTGCKKFYLFIDEIQMSDAVKNPYNPEGKKITFYDAINDLRELPNLDIYVTGSNSAMLSSDILTEFRGRSSEIHMHPLSFAEYYNVVGGEKQDAFNDYSFYGGMPFLLSRDSDAEKCDYLQHLFSAVYLRDIAERNHLHYSDVLEEIVNLLCSSVGSLINPNKIANTLHSKQTGTVSPNTVRSYLHYLQDAFLFSSCRRYDVRGKTYFDSPAKYYCEDIGLRNARINFKQQDAPPIIENIIYNDLIIRQFTVDVGVLYSRSLNFNGNSVRTPHELDFVANKGNKKVYIQSAYAMPTGEKTATELMPFSLTGDSFPKIIIRGEPCRPWYNDQGILNINILDFLLSDDVI